MDKLQTFASDILPDFADFRKSPETLAPTLKKAVLPLLCQAVSSPLSRNSKPLSATHRFLFLQGLLYIFIGMCFLLVPKLFCMLLLTFIDDAESKMLMVCGVTVVVIGYFYMQCARSNTEHTVMDTTFDRLTLVPALMVFCMLCGCRSRICLAFIILDPVLATLTALKWSQEKINYK
eukprot:TRINITY_DN27694_c0_g1_i1.p1 TRINITY_DN27694_c0_g1~~TRINITY_DN27694_c0_g1_i1.p1  ORF type:complete len:195 (-),score=28.44 TRINITY_DN27694_c0_g1_i1:209-739(-)